MSFVISGGLTRGPDLLGKDVGVACVAGNLGDHAQVNESQAHRADKVVFDGVV